MAGLCLRFGAAGEPRRAAGIAIGALLLEHAGLGDGDGELLHVDGGGGTRGEDLDAFVDGRGDQPAVGRERTGGLDAEGSLDLLEVKSVLAAQFSKQWPAFIQ